MIATAIPYSILAVKGYGYESKGGAHAFAMADFIAIVVPLASPIQPVATSKHDTE
jgi:hypothetical protein